MDRPVQAADPRERRQIPHLFPAFPGCDRDTGLYASLTFTDRNCRELSARTLDHASGLPGELAVQAMVKAYIDELEAVAEDNRVDVINVARPDTLDDVHLAARAAENQAAGQSTRRGAPLPVIANFQDLLKARCGWVSPSRSCGAACGMNQRRRR